MKWTVSLRIACVLILIHLLGHTMGHLGWKKPEDPEMRRIVHEMLSYKGNFIGASQSMGDYFHGYSLIMFIVFALSIAVLWLASCEKDVRSKFIPRLLIGFGAAYVLISVIEALYFFPFAAAVSFLAALMIFYSVIALRRIRNPL
jgi:hypothetical protein